MNRIALLFIAVLALVSNVSARNGSNANIEQVQDTTVLGKLYFVNLKEGEQPVMTGLSLHGNTCGTGAFNSKPYATEGIRSVFELDEWIEFHPQARVGGGIKVKDPNEEETYHWGSFYLHPEEVNPGYYDFVFIYNNKVFATMLTKFYKPDELLEKPDSELEKLMKD